MHSPCTGALVGSSHSSRLVGHLAGTRFLQQPAEGMVTWPKHAPPCADLVYFSPDNGACWHKVQLPEALSIDNIRWAGTPWVGCF